MLQKILILDKDLSMCQKFSGFLRSNNYVTASTCCNKEALQLIKASSFDLILCDSEFTNAYPVEFLEKIKSFQPEIPIISISNTNNVQTAVELMRSGAFYFFLKPVIPEQLLDIIRAALKKGDLETKPLTLMDKKGGRQKSMQSEFNNSIAYPYVKGVSKIARKLYKSIELVAPTDYTVIIHGETGTGKESVARMIHENSRRSNQPFVAVDCGSLSKELAASELFGHEKGAFTGALQNREGAFRLADKGTLFLDEIGNLSYSVQQLLLRVIQQRVIRKVGSVAETPVDVRLIVASNENLNESVNQRKFREDLFHRLNEFTVTVPALRDRKEDLKLFIQSFVVHASQRLNKDVKMPDKDAMDILEAYYWPGNIRELLNTIKKACLMTPPGKCISALYLPYEVKSLIHNGGAVNTFDQRDAIFDEFKEDKKMNLVAADKRLVSTEAGRQVIKSGHGLKDIATTAELQKILITLKTAKFNKSKAAKILNIDRKTLYNKLKKIDI